MSLIFLLFSFWLLLQKHCYSQKWPQRLKREGKRNLLRVCCWRLGAPALGRRQSRLCHTPRGMTRGSCSTSLYLLFFTCRAGIVGREMTSWGCHRDSGGWWLGTSDDTVKAGCAFYDSRYSFHNMGVESSYSEVRLSYRPSSIMYQHVTLSQITS